MKKIIFFCVVLFTVFGVTAQNHYTCDSLNKRQYENLYLFNHCSREGIDLDVMRCMDCYDGENFNFKIESCTPLFANHYYGANDTNVQTDFAQQYEVNTPITIAGVSGFVWHFSTFANTRCKWYFEIRDSTLNNVLATVDITDTTTPRMYTGYSFENIIDLSYGVKYVKYTEKFFDEPLTLSGKFYVVYHTPDSIAEPLTSAVMGTHLCTPNRDMYPLAKGSYQDNEWKNMTTTGFNGTSFGDTITALYLFPILADNNVSSIEEVSNLEAVRVFPNPADNEVNINSGYKIEKIFLYDETGKLLQEKELKAYNYKIDLQHYPQGSYLLKVQTTKNQSTHKIIKQ